MANSSRTWPCPAPVSRAGSPPGNQPPQKSIAPHSLPLHAMHTAGKEAGGAGARRLKKLNFHLLYPINLTERENELDPCRIRGPTVVLRVF